MALRQEIVEGGFKPGEKLSESRLAEHYGVSRTPVREAIKQLELEQFVTVERRRGTFVRVMTVPEVLDLYEVREALEGMAARLCAQRADNTLLSRLDGILRRMEVMVGEDDRSAYLACDLELHAAIFEGANNLRLLEQYGLLTIHMQRDLLGHIVTGIAGRMARSMSEHGDLVQAITLRSADEAESRMRSHVISGRQELASSMALTHAAPAKQRVARGRHLDHLVE